MIIMPFKNSKETSFDPKKSVRRARTTRKTKGPTWTIKIPGKTITWSGRDSEIVLVLTELLEFGTDVFNSETEKFQRWLQKPNISLGGATPISMFDSLTGIQEVRNFLNRLEYGNLAN